MATQDYNSLVQKYATKYNLDVELVKKILENLSTGSLPKEYLSKAVDEGLINTTNPAELDPESGINVAVKYVSDIAKDTKTRSPIEILGNLAVDVPQFNPEKAYVDYLNVVDPAPANSDGTADTSQAYYQVPGANNAPDNTSNTSGVKAEQYMGMGIYDNTSRPAIPVDSTGEYVPTPVTPTTDATNKSTDGFADPISFDALYNRLDNYDKNLNATIGKVNYRQDTIDKRNSTLSLNDIDVAKSYEDKSSALGKTADDYGAAQEALQAGMQTNQDNIVKAYDATFKDANLDVTDPNHNSLVQAYRLENEALSKDALRASASARKLRTAPILSRASMGMMIFGNVYQEGLKDTVTSQQTLNKSYEEIMKVNKTAYDNSLLTNVNKDDLKVAYDTTINTIKAKNKQRVFDATKEIATFKTQSDLINAMNANDIQAMNNDLKVLELSGKGVDTESKVVELRLKEIRLNKEAKTEKDTARLDAIRLEQAGVNLENTRKAGVRADKEYNAKLKSGGYDPAILKAERQLGLQSKEITVAQQRVNLDDAKQQSAYNKASGKYDTNVGVIKGQTAKNKAKVNLAKSQVDAELASNPDYKSMLATTTQLELQASNANAKASIAQSGNILTKAYQLKQWYANNPNVLSNRMLADKLTVDTKISDLQSKQAALADVNITDVQKKALELDIARTEAELDKIKIEQEAGYPTLKADVAKQKLLHDSNLLGQDAQIQEALLNGYKAVTGDGTANVVPAVVNKDKALQVAILSYEANGSLADNPLEAMQFAERLLPAGQYSYSGEAYNYLRNNNTRFSRTSEGVSIDLANDSASVRTAINDNIISQKKKVYRELDKADTPFGFKDLDSIYTVLSKQDVTLANSLKDDADFQTEFNKAITPKDKIQAVLRSISKGNANVVDVASKAAMFVESSIQVNNITNRLDLLGLQKQKDMKLKTGEDDLGTKLLNTFARPAFLAPKYGIANTTVNLADTGDLVKLITYNYFDLSTD